MRTLLLPLCFALVVASPPAPPDPSKLVAEHTINLDLAPEQRWTNVTKVYKDYVINIVNTFKSKFNQKTRTAMAAAMKKTLPDDYAREIQGIASAAGASYDDIIMVNMYYELDRIKGSGEIFKMCTSIVAQNDNGTMYLGHNFDYPSFFAEGLFNARFIKSGKMVFQGLVAGGSVGIITGVTPGSHAIAIDARVDNRVVDPSLSLDDAVKAAESGSSIFIHLTRRALEAGSFDAAVKLLQQKPGMISPGYFILGGSKPNQGAVVTGNTSAFHNDVWTMKNDTDGWFMVETNYDHWHSAPVFDDRRDIARKRLKAIGGADISLGGVWNVLSVAPVLAPTTLTTHLVDIAAGEHRAYHRHTQGSSDVVV